jgi:DNA-binding Lrp family transcriptional regulator
LRRQEQEITRLKSELAQPIAIDGLDILAIARRLREKKTPLRETAQIIGLPESTLRSRLDKVAQNGAHE